MADQSGRQQTLDPQVAGILSGFEQRQSDAHLPRKERSKKAREREKMQQRKAGRATYDLPPELRQRITQIAERHGTTASQVAGLLLSYGLNALESGEIDLDDYKIASNTPRYETNLDLTKIEI